MPAAMMMMSGAVAAPGGGPGGYGYYRTITIDHTLVGSTDATNFPLLISFSAQTFLKVVGSGGKVESSSGYDIAPFTSSALTTLMDFEVEKWSGSAGDLIMWIRVPTVSHTSDTVIYLAYGSTTVTTDQSNTTGVWDSNYKVVHHLGDGTTLSLADSTSNANNGTGFNTPHAGTGKIYGGITHIADDAEYERVTHSASGQAAVTVSFWANPTSNSGSRGLYSWAGTAAPTSGTPFILIQNNAGQLRFYVDGGYQETSASLSTSTWYYLVCTLASSTTWKFYKDGALLSTYTGGVAARDSDGQAHFVKSGFGAMSFSIIDEFRVSLSTRGPDWITAEYNNQNNPGTFSTLGSEVPT